ncbi:hypothetical protein Droror1_Dr00012312 [Drosera rotundifolia]
MEPPLINEGSFSTANPSLAEIWPPDEGGIGGCCGGGRVVNGGSGNGSVVDDGGGSTVTERSGCGDGGGGGGKRRRDAIDGVSSKLGYDSTCGKGLDEANAKRIKSSGRRGDNGLNAGCESSSGYGKSMEKSNIKQEPPKDYIHVRARRGQATDSHSLAERARREKISERMKILQDLVPGCNKIIGKALVLDEIINYIQSLQWQVEFLSMKLEAVVDSGMAPNFNGFVTKEISQPAFDATAMLYGSQEARDYAPAPRPGCLHMPLEPGFRTP